MPKSGKFGTFGGVFTPSILTILGVIMYMRLGWVVGNAGALTTVFVIIMMAHIVSITTGLSVSSIATDKKIKAGGIYYMLSRSLGFPIGGAIGLTLFVATAFSIALYLIGFGESALLVMQDSLGIEEITINHLRIVGSLALLMIVTIAFISTSIAIKTQYFILVAIVLSLVSIFMGTSEGKGFDISEIEPSTVGFATLFGIFFPAVTGFTAGVAMSGDLKDPKKSIPWGTMLAVAVGLVVYLGLAIFIFYSIPLAELQKNNNALVEFGWVPQFVIAGIWGATLSSALGGILGAPRILQAMSLDRITPYIFAKGKGKENEPRNALILTFVLAEAGILIGELDVIAEVVAMFYLAAYMFINLSCFLEKWASPDFRPTFKISIFIPLLGALATLLLMIQLNIAATIASVIIILLIFLWLTRKQLELRSGDVWQNVWNSIVKFGLKNLNKGDVHKRNWEPNILLFSGGTTARPYLIEFSISIAGRNGMISNFDLIEDKNAKVLFPKQKQSIFNKNPTNDPVFYRRKTCRDIYEGIETIASTYGFSGIEPNTVLMGWVRNTKHPKDFSRMTNILHQLDYNVLFLDYDKKRGFGKKQKIDIWWRDLSQISYFTVQLIKLINASPDWAAAEVRFLYFDKENNERVVLENEMQKRVSELRKNVEIKVVNDPLQNTPFYEVVKSNSFEADLIVMDLPELGKKQVKDFIGKTNELLDVLGTTLIIKASSRFYEESTFNAALEKEYATNGQGIVDAIALPESSISLGQCRFAELDKNMGRLDEYIQGLNRQFGTDIYAEYAEVLNTFISLLKEETLVSGIHKKAISLVEDIKENRLNNISDKLSASLNKQFVSLGDYIERMPKKIVRIYTDEELNVRFGDSESVLKFKRAKKRFPIKPKSTISLNKVSRYHFESAYLVHFEKVLHAFGESTILFNSIIKKWSSAVGEINNTEEKTIQIEELQTQIERALKNEQIKGIKKLDAVGRKFCNNITKDVDKLNSEKLAQLEVDKEQSSRIKEIKQNLAHYPYYWQQNSVYLCNQMLLNFNLQELKKNIWPIVLRTKKDLVEKILMTGSELFQNIHGQIATLTEIEINELEEKLIETGAAVNIDESVKGLMLEIDRQVVLYCRETEVISPQQMDDFGNTQLDIVAENIDVKRVAEYLIDNEIVVELKSSLQTDFIEVKSEFLKVENALHLLKYSLSSSQSENIGLLEEVKTRVGNQLEESRQKLKDIGLRLELQIGNISNLLNSLLTDHIIINRASQINGIIRKGRARRGLNRYVGSIGDVFENANNKIDDWVIKLRDLWTISGHQYRTKSLQNPHARLASYVDKITLQPSVEKEIPFFYNQLFSGKHTAPLKPLANRKLELLAAKTAIGRFKNGNSGAILFTGEPLSGLSYLLENVTNSFVDEKVIIIKPPSRHNRKPEKFIHEALVFSTGIHEETAVIFNKLPAGTVLVFEDLELWWTRRKGGTNFINFINGLIAQFGHRILFILSCNIYFYNHIRQYTNIDANLLDTIMTSPLTTAGIKKVILKRHHSGGMVYLRNDKKEKNLRTREQNKLFKRIAAVSEGNIGMALHLWLGNISEIKENKLHLGEIEISDMPPVLPAEWETMLLQILLHKQLTFRRLASIYHPQKNEKTKAVLESLLRTSILTETAGKRIVVNPFVLPYLIKYFRRNGLV